MISSFFMRPRTVGAMFARKVEQSAFERTWPISGRPEPGVGAGDAGTSEPTTASKMIERFIALTLRVRGRGLRSVGW